VIKFLELPEYKEYVDVLRRYKAAKSYYMTFLNRFGDLEFSADPLERARFFDEKALHSRICKEYYYAKTKYQKAAAKVELLEKGIKLPAISTSTATQTYIPVSMEDITKLEETRKATEAYDKSPVMRAALREFGKLHGVDVPAWVHEYDEEDGVVSEESPTDTTEDSTTTEAGIAWDEDFDKL
jgi:hypothetical protein